MLTDRQLVEQILGGDTQAFGSMVRMTEGLVAHIVFKMIPNEEDRKDTAQDIYLKVYRHLRHFKFESKLSTWIGQIAYNTCLNRLEKRQLAIYEAPLRDEAFPGEVPGTSFLPAEEESDRLLLRKEMKGLLQLEIGRLPPLYQTLIGLYHQEELSYGEISRITGLPEGTVKSYLFRARRRLKDSMLSIYKKERL